MDIIKCEFVWGGVGYRGWVGVFLVRSTASFILTRVWFLFQEILLIYLVFENLFRGGCVIALLVDQADLDCCGFLLDQAGLHCCWFLVNKIDLDCCWFLLDQAGLHCCWFLVNQADLDCCWFLMDQADVHFFCFVVVKKFLVLFLVVIVRTMCIIYKCHKEM